MKIKSKSVSLLPCKFCGQLPEVESESAYEKSKSQAFLLQCKCCNIDVWNLNCSEYKDDYEEVVEVVTDKWNSLMRIGDEDMVMLEYEQRVVSATRDEMNKAESIDTLNKAYRQARIWNRYHYYLTGSCTKGRYTALNNAFKQLRDERRAELGRAN